ncbi:unnamed protein product [Phytophthora lilii]|uniref:Unnamed protein product n=1 Tax=Phytophthora lilii TaxID=2077276 RepID=A0A9W6XA52_9STRA|nr:unnamed protein product [Phytophthora lilii]
MKESLAAWFALFRFNRLGLTRTSLEATTTLGIKSPGKRRRAVCQGDYASLPPCTLEFSVATAASVWLPSVIKQNSTGELTLFHCSVAHRPQVVTTAADRRYHNISPDTTKASATRGHSSRHPTLKCVYPESGTLCPSIWSVLTSLNASLLNRRRPAHVPQLRPAMTPAPAHAASLQGLRYTEGRFLNARGQQLFYCAAFPPAETRLRGVALFLHGIGEHSLRFAHVYRHLCLAGYGVIAYDMLGHGRSDCEKPGLRAHGSEFHFFVDDTNQFVTAAKLAVYSKMLPEGAVEPPLIIMGISFGALVALNTILSGKHHFSGCVVASPAIAVEYTPALRIMETVSKPLVWLFPTARLVAGVNFAGLTRDPEFLKDYMADPLNVTDNLTTRMAVQVSLGMKQLQSSEQIENPNSTFCKVPLLVLQGTEDKVTSVKVVEDFMARAANKDKELKLFPGLFHCLWNEPEKQQVMDYASNWLNARFAPSAEAPYAAPTSLASSKL